MLDQIHKIKSKTSIPKFTSKISLTQQIDLPPQTMSLTDLARGPYTLTKMIEESQRCDKLAKIIIERKQYGCTVIENKILTHIDVNITYEKGKEKAAATLMTDLILLLEELKNTSTTR
ncbi:MAG: hypothetical protein KAW47_04725 [Thermoplasmatales archaeon]|nr:hypothetical protein [Thermoplasmatales archaeon]